MPRHASFQVRKSADGWALSIPASAASDGKRHRRFFARKEDAEALARKLRGAHNSGIRGGMIPVSLAREASEARAILDPLGISLVEAARMAAASLSNAEQLETFAERHARATLAGEMRWSKKYARDIGYLPRWLGPEFMALRCGQITPGRIAETLARLPIAQSTRDMRAALTSAILGYKEKHRRDRTRIAIMTPAQIELMFADCHSVEERRAFALLVYAGIRPDSYAGEITRMDWDMIRDGAIHLPASITKTNADRIILIRPVLARILEGHPASGTVCPARWQGTYIRVRKAAGIAGVNDVTRHTFASMHLALYGEDATKEAMGHTAGSRTLFAHYRRAVRKEDAEKFFA
jgi:hypothetical protein